MGLADTTHRWLVIAVTLVLATALVGRVSGDTGAYFADARAGAFFGACGAPVSPPSPIRLAAGASKQLHDGQGDEKSGRDTIAQYGGAGALSLDFGQALPGHGNTRPDVLRVCSDVTDPRVVLVYVTGTVASLVQVTGTGESAQPFVLGGSSTQRIAFRVRVPDTTPAGTYDGSVVIHIQGGADDVRIPVEFDVIAQDANHGQAALPPEVPVPGSQQAQESTQTVVAEPITPVLPETGSQTTVPGDAAQESTATPSTPETPTPVPASGNRTGDDAL